MLKCNYDHKNNPESLERLDKEDLEKILVQELQAIYTDLGLAHQRRIKPRQTTHLHSLRPVYPAFREDVLNRVGEYGEASFTRHGDRRYWLSVIEETDKCIKGRGSTNCFEEAQESVWNKLGEELWPERWKAVQGENKINRKILDRFWRLQGK